MLNAIEFVLTLAVWAFASLVLGIAIGRAIARANQRECGNDEHSENLGIGGGFYFHGSAD